MNKAEFNFESIKQTEVLCFKNLHRDPQRLRRVTQKNPFPGSVKVFHTDWIKGISDKGNSNSN